MLANAFVPKTLARAGCLAAGAVLAGRLAAAELQSLAVVEAANYQTLTSQCASFFQAAGLSGTLVDIGSFAGRAFLTPNLAGVDVTKPIRLFMLVGDPPVEQPHPAVLLPVVQSGEPYLAGLKASYAQVNRSGAVYLAEGARNAEAPDPLYVALVGAQAVASPDLTALRWVVTHMRDQTLPVAILPDVPLRMTLTPDVLAASLEAFAASQTLGNAPAATVATLQAHLALLARVVRDLERLSIGLAPGGRGLGLTVRARARSGTPLAQAIDQPRSPDTRAERALTGQPLFSIADATPGFMARLPDYYLEWLESLADATEFLGCRICPRGRGWLVEFRDLLGGARVGALLAVPTKTGLAHVQLFTLRGEPAEAEARLQRLVAALPASPAFGGLATNAARVVKGVTIHSFLTTAAPAARPTRDAPQLDLSVILADLARRTHVELAVCSNLLVSVHGPAGSLEAFLPDLQADPPGGLAALDRIRRAFPEPVPALCGAATFAPVNAMRVLASLVPGVDAEQLARFPETADGGAMVVVAREQELTWTTRITSSEVYAMKRIFSDQRTLLQDLLAQVAVQQHQGERAGRPAVESGILTPTR